MTPNILSRQSVGTNHASREQLQGARSGAAAMPMVDASARTDASEAGQILISMATAIKEVKVGPSAASAL